MNLQLPQAGVVSILQRLVVWYEIPSSAKEVLYLWGISFGSQLQTSPMDKVEEAMLQVPKDTEAAQGERVKGRERSGQVGAALANNVYWKILYVGLVLFYYPIIQFQAVLRL